MSDPDDAICGIAVARHDRSRSQAGVGLYFLAEMRSPMKVQIDIYHRSSRVTEFRFVVEVLRTGANRELPRAVDARILHRATESGKRRDTQRSARSFQSGG